MNKHPWIAVWWTLIVFGLLTLVFSPAHIIYVVTVIVIIVLFLTFVVGMIAVPLNAFLGLRSRKTERARPWTAQVKREEVKRRQAEANKSKLR